MIYLKKCFSEATGNERLLTILLDRNSYVIELCLKLSESSFFRPKNAKTCPVLIYPSASSNRLLRGKNNVLTSLCLRRGCSRAMLQKWEIASEKTIQTACNRRICRPAVGCSSDINLSYASESSKLAPNFLHGMFNAVLFHRKCFSSSYACVFSTFCVFFVVLFYLFILSFYFFF